MNVVSLSIEAAALSDVGCLRQQNQDVIIYSLELGCCIVADGIGGMPAGDVAAEVAVESLYRYIRAEIGTISGEELIYRGMSYANDEVYSLSCAVDDYNGMGSTLCCLLMQGDKTIIAHIGDSRIYRYRDFALQQMTCDHRMHSQLGPYHSDKILSKIITRAVGIAPEIEPEISVEQNMRGDLYIVCTDGLTDAISEDDIETILFHTTSIQTMARDLVDLAKQRGGEDNVTIGIVEVI